MAENKISLQVQSVLTVIMVCIITPLIAGGSISLAADFAGENLILESPDDLNGFAWQAGSQGDCITTSLSGIPTTTQALSSATTNYAGNTYTSVTAPFLNGSSSHLDIEACAGKGAASSFKLILPNNLFERNESHSRFTFEAWSSSGCTSSCSTQYYDTGYEFDWWIEVNGSEVFGNDDVTIPGFKQYGSNVRFHMLLNYSLNVVEYNDLTNSISECENQCEYVMHFDNVVHGDSTVDYTSFLFEQGNMMRVDTYALDDLDGSLVMTVTPWALTAIFSLVALASTSWWNPVFKAVGENMKKQGGLY
jgi:hypothetical protein